MNRNNLWFRVIIYLMLAAMLLSTIIYSFSIFTS